MAAAFLELLAKGGDLLVAAVGAVTFDAGRGAFEFFGELANPQAQLRFDLGKSLAMLVERLVGAFAQARSFSAAACDRSPGNPGRGFVSSMTTPSLAANSTESVCAVAAQSFGGEALRREERFFQRYIGRCAGASQSGGGA